VTRSAAANTSPESPLSRGAELPPSSVSAHEHQRAPASAAASAADNPAACANDQYIGRRHVGLVAIRDRAHKLRGPGPRPGG